MDMPARGIEREALFATMETYRQADNDWRAGRTFGYIFYAGREIEEVAKRAFTMFLSENALDPTVFPSLLRFENDIISMAAAHLHGDADHGAPDVAGAFTSGGTESILLAVKSARDWARAHRPEITEPEMILPVTAHAAFHKAAHYLGVRPVLTPVDPRTFRADVDAIRDAITERTILLVGSAPSYAHGVIDPIGVIGALAEERGLWLHVDACIGGFLLPFFGRLGAPVPDFDFSVPGVTSISMDLHKYAFAPKGASVVLYRERARRRHQIFACADWTGYTLVNATVQSSKSGGPLAAAWAVLNFVGAQGYLDIARGLRDAARELIDGIASIPGLRVLGAPDMSLIAMAADPEAPGEPVDVFVLADQMKARGWYVQPQLALAPSPSNIHLSITPANIPWTQDLLKDLATSAEASRGVDAARTARELRPMLARLDPTTLDEATFQRLLGMAGMGGVSLPDEMAPINHLMDALPPSMRGQLLIEFINQLFRPTP